MGRLVAHQAAFGASAGLTPEVALPLMGGRAAQEAVAVAQRTAKHHSKF